MDIHGRINYRANHKTISGDKTVCIDKILEYKHYKFAQTSLMLGGGKDYQCHIFWFNKWEWLECARLTKKDLPRLLQNFINKQNSYNKPTEPCK